MRPMNKNHCVHPAAGTWTSITLGFVVRLEVTAKILLMEEIRRLPVEVGSLSSHYLQGFFTSKRWLGMGFLNHQQHHLISSPTDFEDWLVVGLVSGYLTRASVWWIHHGLVGLADGGQTVGKVGKLHTLGRRAIACIVPHKSQSILIRIHNKYPRLTCTHLKFSSFPLKS